MKGSLHKEFKFYLDHQEELVRDHEGEYVVIVGSQIIGFYGSQEDAIKNASQSYELGTFLVQKVEPGDESYTHTYHSRAIIR